VTCRIDVSFDDLPESAPDAVDGSSVGIATSGIDAVDGSSTGIATSAYDPEVKVGRSVTPDAMQDDGELPRGRSGRDLKRWQSGPDRRLLPGKSGKAIEVRHGVMADVD
jgi:hypothetical protein